MKPLTFLKVEIMSKSELIHSCCDLSSKFLISYKHGGTYKVCQSCFEQPEWSNGIERKEILE